jgi:hypothetical protein
VVCKYCETSPLQHIPEVADAAEDGPHLPVKGAVVDWCLGWPWLCDSSHGHVGPLQRPGRRSRRRLHSCKWRGTRTEPAQCRRLVNFRIVSPASVDRAAGGDCSLELPPRAWTAYPSQHWQLPPHAVDCWCTQQCTRAAFAV